jgi:hypothetical protein
MLRFLKTKTFLVIAIVAVLVGVYAILGFVVAPRLVRSALLEKIPENVAAIPTVGEIRINPFLFQVTVDDFNLAGRDGAKLLGFKRLFVDFELSSLWHRAYSFGSIVLSAPYVDAALAKDGALNLAQLEPKAKPESQPAAAAKDEPLPALRIGSFQVTDGLVSYEDHSRPDAFAARLEPINFELREFTTGVQGGTFTFTGSSKQGERIEWHGHVSVDPIASDGEFQIDGLLARTLWDYLQDQLNFVVDRGKIDVAARYRFTLKDPASAAGDPQLQLALSRVTLSDLTVRPRVGAGLPVAAPWLTVPSLTVTDTTVDLAKRHAQVDSIALRGVELVAWRNSDGSLNLAQLALAPGAADPGYVPHASGAPGVAAPNVLPVAAARPTVTATHAATPAGAAAPPWTFDLREFDLREASLAAEDRTTRPAVKVALAPLSLSVTGISQDFSKPVTVAFETRINQQGTLSARGAVTPQPAVADLALKFDGVDLALAQPYIAQHTAMTLLGGRLGGEVKVHYGKQKSAPGLRVAGNITVEKLHTVDNTLHDDFVNWDRLDLQGLNFTQDPDRLAIDKIRANKLYARVIIESDETINAKRVLMLPGADVPARAAAEVAATAAALKAASRNGQRGGGGATAAAASAAAASAAAASAAAASAAAASAPGMPILVKTVELKDGQANFADFSITPNFATGIQALNGTVVGLSSKPGTRAKVDLQGSIDTFSPVSITGEVNVLGPLFVDLALSFRNISLPVFNPYSGKFAGYDISKGKLTTELSYKIDGRKLDAHHHIVIEQLEFGDKTVSKDAVSLPVKLAVSLLKDRNGVIDLDLPVAGTLDDPQFKLGAVIWQVFVHILEKAVTAPFALLGSLFGGGPDIQFINFKPGMADLEPSATDKAKTVARALLERPQLKLEVPIGVVPDVDGPALVSAQFDSELKAAQAERAASAAKPKAVAVAAVPYGELAPEARVDLLTAVYVRDFAGRPKFPEEVSSIKTKPELAAAQAEFLSAAIRAHIVVGEAELQQLAQQRALAVQKALLTDTQVDPQRIFLVSNDKVVAKDGLVRLELSLK